MVEALCHQGRIFIKLLDLASAFLNQGIQEKTHPQQQVTNLEAQHNALK